MLAILYVFSVFAFLCDSIHMPINQVDPPTHTDYRSTGGPVEQLMRFVTTIRYCHNYPDIMCYERPGNGFTGGDEGVWLISSNTDASGLGTVHVQFPPVINSLRFYDDLLVDGLWYPQTSYTVTGLRVFLTSFSPDVRIGKEGHLTFIDDVPMQRWGLGVFIPFSGHPNAVHHFALRRVTIPGHAPPPPYEGPHQPGEVEPHDDL